jgi:hypothetical protein
MVSYIVLKNQLLGNPLGISPFFTIKKRPSKKVRDAQGMRASLIFFQANNCFLPQLSGLSQGPHSSISLRIRGLSLGNLDRIPDRFISFNALPVHAHQDGNVNIHIIVNPDHTLVFVEAMEAAGILLKRTAPGNRHD